jgi:hypothetical protein
MAKIVVSENVSLDVVVHLTRPTLCWACSGRTAPGRPPLFGS